MTGEAEQSCLVQWCDETAGHHGPHVRYVGELDDVVDARGRPAMLGVVYTGTTADDARLELLVTTREAIGVHIRLTHEQQERLSALTATPEQRAAAASNTTDVEQLLAAMANEVERAQRRVDAVHAATQRVDAALEDTRVSLWALRDVVAARASDRAAPATHAPVTGIADDHGRRVA